MAGDLPRFGIASRQGVSLLRFRGTRTLHTIASWGELCMSKSLVEMASEIIAAQARHAPMSPEEISEGVKKVFVILQQLQVLEAGMPGTSEGEGIGKLTPQDSIQRNRVICLECHKEFKLLSNRHLALHGMNSREYKRKYGLPMRQALSSKSLTLARRKIAKEKGLGEKLMAHRRKRI